MFFADPVAGSANLCRPLRPGGRLAFVCWQSRFTSEWMTVPGAVFRSFVGAPDLGLPEGPGPFALAHPERVVEILTAAGFETIGINRCTSRSCSGTTLFRTRRRPIPLAEVRVTVGRST